MQWILRITDSKVMTIIECI